MIYKLFCEHCKKDKEILSSSGTLNKLTCGHWKITKKEIVLNKEVIVPTEIVSPAIDDSFPTKNKIAFNATLYPFQSETVERMNKTGRLLIAHEMGLGKTICALKWLSENEQALPAIILVKSSARIQWLRELRRFIGFMNMPCQPILTSSDPLFPGAKVYIVSIDSLSAIGHEKFDHCKTVILDEAQTIKNIAAKRTRAVMKLCNGKDYFFPMSGTPIKNRFQEYFPVLNILAPERFRSESAFIYKYAKWEYGRSGAKVIGLRYPDQFFADTHDIVFRKTREEVLPDLPKIRRTFTFVDMSDLASEAYDSVVQDFGEYYDEHQYDADAYTNILAYLAKMRHITGLSKVDSVIDHVTDFLLSTDRKITVFVHHKDVGAILCSKINSFLSDGGYSNALQLTSDLSLMDRQSLVDKFKDDPNSRVLIASTLASGESLNLQFCSDAVFVERQWNPSNEEQAEGRFSRIGSLAESIQVTYILAVSTIDEYFSELVEQKRSLISQILDNENFSWSESDMVKELTNIILKKGYKKWQMPK